MPDQLVRLCSFLFMLGGGEIVHLPNIYHVPRYARFNFFSWILYSYHAGMKTDTN